MTSIAYRPDDVIVGVDTHKDVHVAYACNGLGRKLATCQIATDRDGYARLRSWAQELGRVVAYGVEGTGSYGYGLAGFLRRHGERLVEVDRPDRTDRSRHGKDDTRDACHAARAVLAGTATTTPKAADGAVEAIRLVKIARDGAVTAQSQAMITLKAVLVTADDELRGELEPLSAHKLVAACANLPVVEPTSPASAVRYTLASLAKRWLAAHEAIKTHTRHLTRLTTTSCPQLLALFGVGVDTAAEMLIALGDNRQRIRSEAAFAKLTGTCPIPASSGRTVRHRLCRGGNRQANAALYRVAIVRMRWHEPTKAYVARRSAEGKSNREIIRCLKRYIAREIYHVLTAPPTSTDPAEPTPDAT